MDISNRTLGLLLVAAIVVSIGSTFFMLNSVTTAPGFTGYAVSADGTVDLDISNYASITLADPSIDFGDCTLPAGTGLEIYDSSVVNTACTGINTSADFMDLENDGTVNVSIAVKTSETASSIYGTGALYDISLNKNSQTGCATSPASQTTISTSDTTVCSNFNSATHTGISARVHVNQTQSSTITHQSTWTFTATSI